MNALLWFEKIVATDHRDVFAAVKTLRDGIGKGMIVHEVTAADVIAGSVTVDTTYGADPTGPVLMNILRETAPGSGLWVDVKADAQLVFNGDGTLTVNPGAATYVLTAADMIKLAVVP